MSQIQPTAEQRESFTKQFVVMTLSLAVAGVFLLFSYSVVFTQQPLFNESPVDKAIFAVLTLLVGQSLQILANYITKGSAPNLNPTPQFNPCPPVYGMQPTSFSSMTQNLDNSTSGFSIDPTRAWYPPPPPTTPPTLEHDEERERQAVARAEAKDV